MKRTRSGLLALLITLTPLTPAFAQGVAPEVQRPDMQALVGQWRLDPARTHMGRFGPTGVNMVRDPTFTFIFEPKGEVMLVKVYAHYPQDAPTRVSEIVPDGQVRACGDPSGCLTAGGDPKRQSFLYREVSPHLFVRLFFVDGKVTEYSTYAVSEDLSTFTMRAWSAETPHYQNIQVFTKQP